MTRCLQRTQDLNMTIRPTTHSDIPRLREVFAAARSFMTATGNPHQWAASYPSDAQLQNDIESGNSYVIIDGDLIVATFVLRGGDDPTYANIYEGSWPNDHPYATIHRIASAGVVKGIFNYVIRYALTRYSTLRIDTHCDNHVMRHLVERAGFTYCGIIHCWNGDERLAYCKG